MRSLILALGIAVLLSGHSSALAEPYAQDTLARVFRIEFQAAPTLKGTTIDGYVYNRDLRATGRIVCVSTKSTRWGGARVRPRPGCSALSPRATAPTSSPGYPTPLATGSRSSRSSGSDAGTENWLPVVDTFRIFAWLPPARSQTALRKIDAPSGLKFARDLPPRAVPNLTSSHQPRYI